MTNKNKVIAGLHINRIVIKLGTSLLITKDIKPNLDYFNKLANDISQIRNAGIEVILVTSGAIGVGMGKLNMKARPRTIPGKQAVAAVGQGSLMHLYETVFSEYNIQVAQILLTREDVENRIRYLNARNTLLTLLDLKVLPIINENDTVAVEEIKFGENDNLAALITNLIEADFLIILSDTDGLCTKDPRTNKDAVVIPIVKKITPEIEKLAGGAGTCVSTGGMYTKILAGKKVTSSGNTMIIANGRKQNILTDIVLNNKSHGTLFLPSQDKMDSRKKWIAFTLSPQGKIKVDKGAEEALVLKGKSLLPSGIKEIEGKFNIGDAITIINIEGKEIAKGLVNYNYEELKAIRGAKTKDIESLLGYKYFDEVVHRDNMVLL
ncbi:MAG: glutamate 5-kinase [Candidatus Firestonebacteria bacterium]|nr:glutamate 5-kinase [Candidatus Firestonebacteria bacterium]